MIEALNKTAFYDSVAAKLEEQLVVKRQLAIALRERSETETDIAKLMTLDEAMTVEAQCLNLEFEIAAKDNYKKTYLQRIKEAENYNAQVTKDREENFPTYVQELQSAFLLDGLMDGKEKLTAIGFLNQYHSISNNTHPIEKNRLFLRIKDNVIILRSRLPKDESRTTEPTTV